jgi:hypothetical protein
VKKDVCPDCVTARRVVIKRGLTPFRDPPKKGFYPVVDALGHSVKVCWVHVILYPDGVRCPDPGVVLREALRKS